MAQLTHFCFISCHCGNKQKPNKIVPMCKQRVNRLQNSGTVTPDIGWNNVGVYKKVEESPIVVMSAVKPSRFC